MVTEYRTPGMKQNELTFSLNQTGNPKPEVFMISCLLFFQKIWIDQNGFKGKRQLKETRITLHSFRRFVKATIFDLEYSDYYE